MKKEYYIKWVGYDDENNTWKPEDDLDCPGLILDFETEKEAQEERDKNKEKDPTTEEAQPAESKKEEKKVGFDRGLVPLRIIRAKDISGELMFLIQWAGTMEADLVPSRQANVRCPQLVISFYEKRLKWKTCSPC